MSDKRKSTFSHFFKEDAQSIQNILQGENDEQLFDVVGNANKEVFPEIKRPKIAPENQFKDQWKALHLFFRNGNNAKGLPKDFSPVIMAPLYTKTMVGTDFPVWVADENYSGSVEHCSSLKDILTRCLNDITKEGDDAHILRKNLDRIIHIANAHLSDKQPKLFNPVINKILDELENQLEISGDEVFAFNKHLQNFRKALPEDGVLLPYSNNTSFQILEAAMAASQSHARKSLKHDIKQLICRLKDLLRVEREKGPERKNPDKLHDSLSFVDSMVDFNKLSSILPGAGSESIGEERVKRISSVVAELEREEQILDQQNYLFIEEDLDANGMIDWQNIFGNAVIEVYRKGKGCDSLRTSFDQQITAWTKLFTAKKIGELEIANNYQPDVHDGFFEYFTWQSLMAEELISCPQFILISDDVKLFDLEFNKLSAIISANIPVKILAVKRDEFVNHNQNGSGKKEKDLHSHAELGGLMLSHKNIYIAQSTSITPNFLFNGFKEGLSSFAPAFFYVLNVDEKIHENAYLWTSATIESRDFPGFTFKGMLGTAWGSRFNIENNPQPERLWPAYNLTIVDETGNKKEMEFPFTFADQAALNPDYHHYYWQVDSSFWCENLVPLTEYMESNVEDNMGKVPFIWMIDSTNALHKVAVSWPIILATQERLDFWRFLQENSGINNYHVAQAVEQTRKEMLKKQKAEIEQLKRDNQIEIQKVREQEAGKVMENLTSVLLSLDTSNLALPSLPTSKSVTGSGVLIETDKPTKEAKEKIADEESFLSNDPYIDTVMCTSCNECIQINSAMFKYNGDKMAYIADPKAGTFSDLVKAAEICPVKIIHPGAPLNPNESDLDDLIERAKKFN